MGCGGFGDGYLTEGSKYSLKLVSSKFRKRKKVLKFIVLSAPVALVKPVYG